MATSTSQPAATFPVEWSAIQVTGQPFTLSDPNAPVPITPLEATCLPGFGTAVVSGFREIGVPFRAYEIIYPNHFSYSRMIIDEPTPEQVGTIEEALRDAISRQMERWHGEFLPRITTLLASLKAFEVASIPLGDVPAALEAIDTAQHELWTIHFRVVNTIAVSMQLFGELYAELFDTSAIDGHALLAGGLSESLKSAFALDDLAAEAKELELDELILTTSDDGVMAALAAAPRGGAFLAELDAFLEHYGYRQDGYQLTMPAWRESPSLAVAHIRTVLRGGVDTRAHQATVARAAEAAAVHARERLSGYPGAVREQFEAMLAFARHGAFLNEEHNFYIDQQSCALMRLNFIDVGRRLAHEGLLDAPEDVLMLERNELRELLHTATAGGDAAWGRDLVRARTREMTIAATLTPPPYLGDPAGMGEPPDNLITRAMRAHFGGPPVPSERKGELRGMPASRGVATGRARVARSLEEARSVQPGEVLVSVTTTPVWTPLFGVAAAVVTDTGGPLSHGAIVAREYGVPAVVGVHGATTAIQTGMTVTVDGAAGTVVIVG